MESWLNLISPHPRIVGDAPAPAGWVEAMRYIYEHELVIFAQGEFTTDVAGEKIACPEGSYIIVPPGTRHISRAAPNRAGHRCWVHFDWIHAGNSDHLPVMTYCPARPQETLFRPAPLFVPSAVLHGPIRNLNRVMELYQRLESRFNRGTGREKAVARALLLELLLELLTPEYEERPGNNPRLQLASKIRQRLLQIAEHPVTQDFSLQGFLEESGQSYAHQCRVFKQNYGISPLRYITELRMTRIKNLLADTDYPISQIAEMSGYANLGYFSRAFRQKTGLSPREFRIQARP